MQGCFPDCGVCEKGCRVELARKRMVRKWLECLMRFGCEASILERLEVALYFFCVHSEVGACMRAQ